MKPAVAMQTTEQSAVGISTPLVPESNVPVAEKVSRVAHYIYQKVVRRKPVPFQPSPRNPKYLLCYVEEELECGHTLMIYAGDPLVARTRCCHECADWFGALPLKKSMQSVKRMIERSKEAGLGNWWAIIFAAACLFFMVGLLYFNRPHVVIFSPANNQTIVRVLHQYNDFDWQIQRVVSGIPQTTEVRRFDEKPPFEAGMTLSWLAVDERGTVWSVKHINPYYILERDELGWPTLAPNCRQDLEHDHVVCNGIPRWEEK